MGCKSRLGNSRSKLAVRSRAIAATHLEKASENLKNACSAQPLNEENIRNAYQSTLQQANTLRAYILTYFKITNLPEPAVLSVPEEIKDRKNNMESSDSGKKSSCQCILTVSYTHLTLPTIYSV
eukprot:TRINITY_DN2912_c0_g2_i3.p1 TRINITY_DN2912_c0_g2~~TRINITY_DN2912_c0_g2_i3.p1  ORF type:complete len:124 (+),score=17.40 TRINITY_DN2912_c0_g2_i3:275-646(+)